MAIFQIIYIYYNIISIINNVISDLLHYNSISWWLDKLIAWVAEGQRIKHQNDWHFGNAGLLYGV